MKNLISKVKYFFKKFEWINILNSPFRTPDVDFYFGPISRGTPYFLPRKWVPSEKPGHKKPVYIKWGINIVSLGWKTKFNQVRHEWNPMISIVGFNRQFCVYFGLDGFGLTNSCYWEAWVTYYFYTDKKKSKKERLIDTMDQYSAVWSNEKGKTDYYHRILKSKYLNLIK